MNKKEALAVLTNKDNNVSQTQWEALVLSLTYEPVAVEEDLFGKYTGVIKEILLDELFNRYMIVIEALEYTHIPPATSHINRSGVEILLSTRIISIDIIETEEDEDYISLAEQAIEQEWLEYILEPEDNQ